MRQRGFGIPEMLIGIAVGMVIVAAAMSLLQVTLRDSNDNIKMARLEQDLRQAMQMITRDLRRASTWDPAIDVARVSLTAPLTLSGVTGGSAGIEVSSTTSGALASIGDRAKGGTLIHVDNDGNVYSASITDYASNKYTVTLGATSWPADAATTNGVAKGSWNILRPGAALTVTSTCLLFGYDFHVDDGDPYAYVNYGYRYDSANKAVEIRNADAATCASTTSGHWQDLTDPNVVEVTDFSVTDNSEVVSSLGLNVGVRQYTISMTGQLKNNSSVSRTLQETIRVRNDGLSLP